MKKEELLAEIIGIAHGEETDAAQFAKHYLETHSDLTYELRAGLFETLAREHSSKRISGEFYKKAASAWELHYIGLEPEASSVLKRMILKHALANYRRSARAYRHARERALHAEMNTRISHIKTELRQFSTPLKKLSISFVLCSLVLSFFFLAPRYTGLVVAPVDPTDSSYIGFGLVVFGILGMIFVLWKWR